MEQKWLIAVTSVCNMAAWKPKNVLGVRRKNHIPNSTQTSIDMTGSASIVAPALSSGITPNARMCLPHNDGRGLFERIWRAVHSLKMAVSDVLHAERKKKLLSSSSELVEPNQMVLIGYVGSVTARSGVRLVNSPSIIIAASRPAKKPPPSVSGDIGSSVRWSPPMALNVSVAARRSLNS